MTQITMIATNRGGEQLDIEARVGMDKVERTTMQRGQTGTLPVLYDGEPILNFKIDFTESTARVHAIGEDVYRLAMVRPGTEATLSTNVQLGFGCMLPVTLISLLGLLAGVLV